MALPFLMLYLTREKNFTPAEAGLVLSVYGIFGLLGSLVAGFLSDRVRPIVLMRIALMISMVAIGTYPFLENRIHFYLMAGIWALGTEGFRPANSTVLNLITPASDRKLAFSLLRLAINLGMSVGPAFGGFIAEHSFRAIFWVNALALFVGSLILTQLPSHLGRTPKSALPAEHDLTHRRSGELRVYKDWVYLFFLLGIVCVVCVYLQQESVMGLYMTKDLGLLPRHYGMLFAVNTVIIVLFEIPLNVKTMHWSHRRCLVAGALIYAVAFGSFAWATSLIGIAGLVAFYTLGEMIESSAVHASIGDRAPKNRIGEYTGVLTMSFALGNVIGPWIGTRIYQDHGASYVWLFCFCSGVLGALIFWRTPWLDSKR